MSVNAFHRSTDVIGIDACHIKARYGGVVLLVKTLPEMEACSLSLLESPRARMKPLGDAFSSCCEMRFISTLMEMGLSR